MTQHDEGPLAMFYRLLAENEIKLRELKRTRPLATNFAQGFAARAPGLVVEIGRPGHVHSAERVIFSPNFTPSRVTAIDVMGAELPMRSQSLTRYELAPGAVRLRVECKREVRGFVCGWTWPAE